MKILFVRHGHPNYEKDCLTDLGHRHAAAAAVRLREENIAEIFSSTCGRALETAQHTADDLGLKVHPFDFMREINWDSADGQPLRFDGHPWDTADRMVVDNLPLLDPDWANKEPFHRNTVVQSVKKVGDGIDRWLEGLGYRREGQYYRVTDNTEKTVAVFCHGGASCAMLSRMFNLPFPFAIAVLGLDYTGITAVSLAGDPGDLATPKFICVNDARHIQGLRVENYFGK